MNAFRPVTPADVPDDDPCREHCLPGDLRPINDRDQLCERCGRVGPDLEL